MLLAKLQLVRWIFVIECGPTVFQLVNLDQHHTLSDPVRFVVKRTKGVIIAAKTPVSKRGKSLESSWSL